MLRVTLSSPGGETRTFDALNDAVLARGEIARVIRVEASVDGQLLTTYKADGLIAATATGSTGYALAAGGPVLHPQSQDFLLVPVAPHLTAAYTAVLPGTAELRLRITAVHPATLSIDGHINLPLSGEDTVTVRRSPYTVRFLRIHLGASFFGSLEERLKGRQVEPDRKG
jgi:NAD+ kinase